MCAVTGFAFQLITLYATEKNWAPQPCSPSETVHIERSCTLGFLALSMQLPGHGFFSEAAPEDTT